MAVPMLLAALSFIWMEPADGLVWALSSSCTEQPATDGFLVLPAMPNPCMGAASIGLVGDHTSDVRVTLCDLDGLALGDASLIRLKPGQYELAVSGLAPGCYVCVVSAEGIIERDTLIVVP